VTRSPHRRWKISAP